MYESCSQSGRFHGLRDRFRHQRRILLGQGIHLCSILNILVVVLLTVLNRPLLLASLSQAVGAFSKLLTPIYPATSTITVSVTLGEGR